MADLPPLATTLPFVGVDPRTSVELALRSREWGYTAVWASEVDAGDAFAHLAPIATASEMDLGVAVVPVQTRTAFSLAMAALTLQGLSEGRFSLGIGASSETIVSRFGGQDFSRPLTYVRETVEALRPALRGERTTFHGDLVDIGGYRFPSPPPAPVPLVLGSLNTRSLRMAGELGDGVAINQSTVGHTRVMLDQVRAGAAATGRELPDDFPVVARLMCVVTDDAPVVRQFVKAVFAPYVATSVYNRFYASMGFAEEAAAIAAAAERGDKAGMADAYTDEMAERIFTVGTLDEVTTRIGEYVDAGVTVPVIAPLATDLAGATATLQAIGEAWGG